MSYPTTTMTLTPREIELIVTALHESASDRQEWDEPENAAEFVTLERRFARASKDLIAR
jgi:hypothetical protein